MAGEIRSVVQTFTVAQAGHIIHRRIVEAKRQGLSGPAAFAHIVEPGNIAGTFGTRRLAEVVEVVPVEPPRATPDIITPAGNKLVGAALANYGIEGDEVIALAVEVDSLLGDMLPLSGGKSRIQRGEITAGLFKLVAKGYAITGRGAAEVKVLMDNASQAKKSMVWLSWDDVNGFAALLSELTGRNLRMQTEAEWEEKRSELSGRWSTWMQDKYINGTYILRSLKNVNRAGRLPNFHWGRATGRLVEDLS